VGGVSVGHVGHIGVDVDARDCVLVLHVNGFLYRRCVYVRACGCLVSRIDTEPRAQ
jgi:hypothetical protein